MIYGRIVFLINLDAFMLTISFLLLMQLYITLLPCSFIREKLDLLDLRMDAKIFICFIAFFDWILSYVCEHYVFPSLTDALGTVLLTRQWLKLKRERRNVDDQVLGVSIMEEARRLKWRRRGHLFKVVQSQMTD